MKSKTQNNILIIVFVTLAAVGVIVAVLVTGLSKGGMEIDSVPVSDEVSAPEPSGVTTDPESGSSESSPDESTSDESSPDESTVDSSEPENTDEIGQRIVASANALIGVPFVMNGDDPDGFDNSGFIYYVLRDNGFITCPRTTAAQSQMGTLIDRESLKPGDLVFFGNESGEGVGFGGIYIGNGSMIACLNPNTNVGKVDITTDYYVSHFYGGISLY